MKISQATVDQAKASLETSLANLNYAEIRSPVDGIVINRKIEPGQTVAAQFQTPELFIIAPGMRKEMHVHASVDEADIGLIKQARKKKYPVTFTVSTLSRQAVLRIDSRNPPQFDDGTERRDLSGRRLDAESRSGAVAGNDGEPLVQVDQQEEHPRIPNAALRKLSPAPKQVRPEDLPILEGRAEQKSEAERTSHPWTPSPSPNGRGWKERIRRHVWVVEGDLLRAVPVTTGLTTVAFDADGAGEFEGPGGCCGHRRATSEPDLDMVGAVCVDAAPSGLDPPRARRELRRHGTVDGRGNQRLVSGVQGVSSSWLMGFGESVLEMISPVTIRIALGVGKE